MEPTEEQILDFLADYSGWADPDEQAPTRRLATLRANRLGVDADAFWTAVVDFSAGPPRMDEPEDEPRDWEQEEQQLKEAQADLLDPGLGPDGIFG